MYPLNKSDENEQGTTHSISITELPHDLWIVILKELSLTEIFHLSMTNKFFLKLCFNQTLTKDFKPKNYSKPLLSMNEFTYKKDEKDHLFDVTQREVYKPLVCQFFPKFKKTLNVNNWLHVLRRRILHLKIYEPKKLPLQRDTTSSSFSLEMPEFATSHYDQKFIEGCEYIYKCPLKFEELAIKVSASQVKMAFCKECSHNVYLVNDMEEFKERLSKGDCVAFVRKDPQSNSMSLGRACF
ncbi:hypothetical protein C9374_011055 [Naegleria lovaniensis]|uniref:F-box domain-containing protein n=1 Tax=Naegleria lovaniensis TaxID=51637 RepID=A0AA88GG16_NAELO|nr:uncharacterized protein C9374_011055 [Naegleria lovaniensis]KAG2374218.1 hypothetical protein C9374_011055 [Naegleria lovaniensis]